MLKSIEVQTSAKIDEQEVQGSSSKPKQATGYEDAKVNIELILDDTETQTKYQRLGVIRDLFRKPGQAAPQPIPIVSEDTAAHGVTMVLFKDLKHKAESKTGQLPVTLVFWEYIPQTIQAQKKSGSTKKSAAPNNAFSSDYKNYLSGSRGTAPKLGGSPAKDTARPTTMFSRINSLPF